MSTVSTPRLRPTAPVAESQTAPAAAPIAARPRRMRRWLLISLGVALVLAWFAPAIIAHTPVRNWVVGKALGGLKGTVTVDSASLGWMSPIVLRDVKICDDDGREVLTVAELSSEKSLLGLLRAGDDLGQFKIDRPTMHCSLRSDGSNLEDLIAPLLEGPSSQSTTKLTIEVTGAAITVHNSERDESAQLTAVQANVTVDDSGTRIEAAGHVQSDRHPGEFSLTVGPANDTAGAPLAIGLKSRAVPLALVQPLIHRFVDRELHLDGRLDCDLTTQIAESPWLRLDGRVAVKQFQMRAPFLPEPLRLAHVETPLAAALYEGRTQIEQLDLTCDVGRLAAKGDFPGYDTASLGDLWKAIRKNSYQLQTQVDLPQLARTLPNTVRVKDGTRITSGVVDLLVTGRPQQGGQRWQVKSEIRQLSALQNGRQRNWEAPINVSLAAHETPNGPVIDSLTAAASFLVAEGRGSLDGGDISCSCDLDRLAAELRELIDLGDTRLTGKAQAIVKWTRGEQDRQLKASGSMQLSKLEIATPGNRSWTEDNLAILFSLSADAEGDRIQQIVAADATVQAGADRLTLVLTAPVGLAGEPAWAVQARLNGKLERWMPRLRPWLSLPGWTIEGDADIGVVARHSAAGTQIAAAQANLANIRIHGGGLFIGEPSITLKTNGAWQNNSSSLTLGPTTLSCTSLLLAADGAKFTFGDKPAGEAALKYQGDLGRLERWFHDPRLPAGLQWAGRLQGGIDVITRGDQIQLRHDGQVHDLAVFDAAAPAPGQNRTPIWQERQLGLTADAVYDSARDSIALKSLDLTSTALRIQAAGAAEALASRCDVTINGQLDYDLETITKLIRSSVGDGIKLAGRESRKFSVRGPLGTATGQVAGNWLSRLTAETSVGWQAAELYGVPVGKGQIAARLGGGNLAVDPLDVQIGQQGRLTLAPKFALSPEPALLRFERGPVLQQVKITPEMCATGLKYIAPSLADSAQAEGLLSLDLNGAAIPLSDPAKGDIGGRVTIHSVDVLPGPTAKSMLLFTKQLEAILKRRPPPTEIDPRSTLLKVANQQVEFRMVQGRVYHQKFEFVLGDVPMRTTGSVGFDQSLNLLAEVPIKDEWLGDGAFASLRGKAISVPVGGTVSSPKLDPSVLSGLVQQAAQGAAQDALNKQIDKGLDRLLRPR